MNPNKYSFINPKKSPFFYGYVTLIFGSIGVLFSIPGQTVGVSVFTDPVKDALGLTRNQFSNAYMIGTLISAFFVTKAGRLFDKFGARYVAFFASFFLGISLILFSFSEKISNFIKSFLDFNSWSVPFVLICILFFLIRFCGQGVLTMSSRNMVMMWFDKNRGKVNSISSITISLGFSISPVILNYLITENGWEVSWQILAVCLFIFSFFILQFYRNKPEDFDMIPDGYKKEETTKEKKQEINFTLVESKKTRAFWMFGLALAFNSFLITGFTFHIISIFETASYTRAEAIAVFLPISVIAICVSTIANILSDYIAHKIYLYIMLAGGFFASYGLLTLSNVSGIYFLIGGLGICSGLFAVVNAVTWPRYFGRKFLGAITGKVMSFMVVASAIAPSLFSYCFTTFGSYTYISYLLLPFLVVLVLGAMKVENPQNKNLES
ncbi:MULTISPECIES: MFS transporter [unclassified Polaribacter]|uniref:MFS transporter n=1 Tax=unclassified Polaribacter TaxID=196858 RepID=UPI0011BE7E2C|nr:MULTISPECIES: MFS transporter [unclassified Polaribacter]TXD48997.1 OFA family MFS transporter [Polaribacter sp. IC063]TXD56021.1 OFA family MFS transporter [Polaribacter sp. IC066]